MNCKGSPSHGDHGHLGGAYGLDYYHGRKTKRQLIYRLRRRTDEVERAIRKYATEPLRVLVDVGTADGLMLEELRTRIGALTFVGVDLSRDLLLARGDGSIAKVQGDALFLPVREGRADVVVATAVIEHVSDAAKMLLGCFQLLRPGGLFVITTPDPVMERFATVMGLLKETGHQRTYDLKELRRMFESSGFSILEARKFMFSPVGFPLEKHIEVILRALRLNVVMANQLIIARKP